MPVYQIIFLIAAFVLGAAILVFAIIFINKVAKEEEAETTREKSEP